MMRKKWIWIAAAVVVFLGIGAVKSSQDKKAAAEETRVAIEEPVETAAPTATPAPTPKPTAEPTAEPTPKPMAEPTPTPELQALAAAPVEEPAAERSVPAEPVPTPSPEKDWVLNTNTGKFHKPSCSSVKEIKESNRRDVHMTREDVIAQGFQPCGKCKP